MPPPKGASIRPMAPLSKRARKIVQGGGKDGASTEDILAVAWHLQQQEERLKIMEQKSQQLEEKDEKKEASASAQFHQE